MRLLDLMPNADFIFNLGGNAMLNRQAEPILRQARNLYAQRQRLDANASSVLRMRTHYSLCRRFLAKAVSGDPQSGSHRAGDNRRLAATSMEMPGPKTIYMELYCARGQAENFIKHLKCDLHRSNFLHHVPDQLHSLATARRKLHAAVYVLHQQLRTQALKLSRTAPPRSSLFKIAAGQTVQRSPHPTLALHMRGKTPASPHHGTAVSEQTPL